MKKGCLPIGCLGFVVLFVLVPILVISQDPERFNNEPKNKIARQLEITVEQGDAVVNALSSVGISGKIDIKHDELLDNAHFEGEKGYRLANNDVSNIILYMNPDGSIFLIKYAGSNLYKQGKVLASISDFIVTSSEKTSLQIRCQETVKSLLKAPSTADFPNILQWKIWKEDGQTIVQSYVDSQNSFGAMIRSEFQFIIKNDKVVSLIIDGKEYVK